MRRFASVSLFLFALLSACQSPTPSAGVSPAAQRLLASAPAQTQILSVSAEPNAAAMAVTLNLGNISGFSTQALDGSEAKTQADIAKFDIFLFESSTGSLPTAGSCPSSTDVASASGMSLQFHQQVSADLTVGTPSTQTFLLQNIPANSSGTSRYFIAVRPLDSADAPISQCSGLAQSSGTFNSIAVATQGPVHSHSTGFAVTSDFIVTPSTAQAISLSLLDAKGAALDVKVSVTDGNTALPPITVN